MAACYRVSMPHASFDAPKIPVRVAIMRAGRAPGRRVRRVGEVPVLQGEEIAGEGLEVRGVDEQAADDRDRLIVRVRRIGRRSEVPRLVDEAGSSGSRMWLWPPDGGHRVCRPRRGRQVGVSEDNIGDCRPCFNGVDSPWRKAGRLRFRRKDYRGSLDPACVPPHPAARVRAGYSVRPDRGATAR